MVAYRYIRPPKKIRDEFVLEASQQLDEGVIRFPSTLSSSDPDALIDFCELIMRSEGDLILDASGFMFIDPLGLATLKATLEAQSDDREFEVQFMTRSMISYLVRMDFFVGLNVEGVDVESGRNPQGEPENCVELLKVTNADQSEEVASRLVHAMTGIRAEPTKAQEMEPYRRPLEYALKELLENALSHAKKEGNFDSSVWVACQHFTSNGTVRLAIVDNGCGFLATLKDHAMLSEKTHGAAINIALIERVSCNRGPFLAYESDSQNQGVGLTTTAKIAGAAEGFLVIASGNAWLRTDCGAEGEFQGQGWKGVAIAFECSREQLPKVDISTLLPKVEGTLDEEINFE